MTQQFLDRADVIPSFEQMGGGAVAERMAASWLDDFCRANGFCHGSLQRFLVDVVPTFTATAWIERAFASGKDILSPPFAAGISVFPLQGKRQVYLSEAFFQVLVV